MLTGGLGPQVVEKLRCGSDAGYQEVIAGAGACDVKQVPLGVVDRFEISIVRDILYALLRRDNLVVAGLTATERNSSPFARCIVPIEILPGVIPILSLSSTAWTPACLMAVRARRSSREDPTNTQSYGLELPVRSGL